ncbi:MAG: acyl-CoA dehydrogenase family protein [Acidimicrobiia bacterium]
MSDVLDPEEFRSKVRDFLSTHLPAGWTGIGALGNEVEEREFLAQWRKTLHANDMLAVSFPKAYGGPGLTKFHQVILAEEFANAQVPIGVPNDTFSIKMVGNTILRWGTEEQKQHFIPRILSGEDVWCQGYSEPEAGSDLAGLRTKAHLDGDEWVINGQKIWTTNAQHANWIFVLARTDPDAPKHKGISFLLVPMHQSGIEVRPIVSMTGHAEFNETFFTDARAPKENVVGPVNGGWAVATSLLGLERGEEAATNPVMFRQEWDRLADMARERGMSSDPVIRQRLAQCYIEVEIMRYVGAGILAKVLAGAPLGPESSISKLYWSEYHKRVVALGLDILGADAMVPEGRVPPRPYRADDPGAPNSSGSWVGVLYNATAGTIYAGTSQVQRNILSENVLGLPREPGPAS